MIKLFRDKNISKKLGLPKRFWNANELSENEKEEIRQDILFYRCLSGADFIKILDEHFSPFMRDIGFKGSKNSFYLHKSPLIYTVGIFKDKYGGSCSLNMGVHLDLFPSIITYDMKDPKKMIYADSIISKTLTLENGNSELIFGNTNEEGLETVFIMRDLIKNRVIPQIDKFSQFPKPFVDIELDHFKKPNAKFEDFWISEKTLDWIHFQIYVARINHSLGNIKKAIEMLKYVREREWNAKRFTKPGASPFIKPIDDLITNYSQHAV